MIAICINVAVLVLFLFFSAFFSASETALFSIPKERTLYYQNKEGKRYYWVYILLKQGQRTLLLILLGNIFVNVTLAGLIHSLLLKFLPHGSTVLSLVFATVVIVLFGEMLPKSIALKNNEFIAVSISPILYHLEMLLIPVLKIIQKINQYLLNRFKARLRSPSPFITIEELKTGVKRLVQDGAISLQEQDMIIGILEQGSEPVRKMMIHRSKLLIVQEDDTVESVLKKMVSYRQKTIIVRSSSDSRYIKGVIHVKDCIGAAHGETIGKQIHLPVLWVPETMEIADLISFLLSEKRDEVCVLDQFGCFSGIITLSSCFSDILRNVFPDESKVMYNGKSRIFDGAQERSQMEGWLPQSLVVSFPNVRTLNGLLTNYIGEIPKSGDRVEIDGYNFYIIKSSPTRIESVLVSKGIVT